VLVRIWTVGTSQRQRITDRDGECLIVTIWHNNSNSFGAQLETEPLAIRRVDQRSQHPILLAFVAEPAAQEDPKWPLEREIQVIPRVGGY
jgi:hypothetical protein